MSGSPRSPDPRFRSIQSGLAGIPGWSSRIEAAPGSREQAAVSLILRGREELELLLIRRAVSERDPWSGHVALPGGRRDPGDASLLHTAVRETREETGIILSPELEHLGPLEEVAPVSPRLPPVTIYPFVFGVHREVAARPDPREVEQAFWVPLDLLRNPEIHRETKIRFPQGGSGVYPSYQVGDQLVWGLTYRIVSRFLQATDPSGRGATTPPV